MQKNCGSTGLPQSAPIIINPLSKIASCADVFLLTIEQRIYFLVLYVYLMFCLSLGENCEGDFLSTEWNILDFVLNF